MPTQACIEFQGTPRLLLGEHPFKYHLLRIGSGDMENRFWHINSIWEGYNSHGYPDAEINARLAKYRFANTRKDIERILNEAKNEFVPNTTYYIMAKMDSSIYESMQQFKD